ncbi:MAG: dihydrofolate reductase [Pirellulales bacterium]
MLSILVAVSDTGVIGRDGELPWRLSADLRRFRRMTTGHAIVMGRKTYESIGRPLPERTNIVVTRQPAFTADGVVSAPDIDAAIRTAQTIHGAEDEVFVVGGAEIYRQTLDRADRLYLTRVHANVAGDTYLPAIDFNHWRLVEESHHAADDKNEFPHTFAVYERMR